MTYFPGLDSFDYSTSRVHPIGRPPKLTAEMIEKIADLIVIGKCISVAANTAGISESTIFRWLALGKKKGSQKIYRDLVERVSEACEFSEFEALQVLRQSSLDGNNWRAAAWILERRHPGKYGKKDVKEGNKPSICRSNTSIKSSGTTG